jgi:hypothetical protein
LSPGPSTTLDAEAIRQIVKEEVKAIPRKSAAESFLFLLFESGGIDGIIRPGDVTTAIIGAGGGSLLWSCVGLGANLMTSLFPKEIIFPWGGVQSLPCDFPTWEWLTATGIVYSCYLAAMRIKRDLEYDPREWTEETEPPTAKETIKLELRDGNYIKFLHFDGEQSERTKLFAAKYLKIAGMSDYPTAEKHYVGSGKIWSNGKADRQSWQEFRQALIDNRLAFEQSNRWHLTESGRRAMMRLTNG